MTRAGEYTADWAVCRAVVGRTRARAQLPAWACARAGRFVSAAGWWHRPSRDRTRASGCTKGRRRWGFAPRSSARSARPRRGRCACSTPPRSSAFCSASTSTRDVHITECRASGGSDCTLAVTIRTVPGDRRSRMIHVPCGVRAIAVLLVLAAAPGRAQPAPATTGPRDTLVMPFENPQTEPRLYWLGEGSAVLLADYLEAYGATTIPREDRVGAFERLQLPPAAALSHATVIKVAQFVGASDVVVGSYELAGEHLTVRARVIRLDAGRLLPEVIERGPLADLFGIYERVARRLKRSDGADARDSGGHDAGLAAGVRALRQGAGRRNRRDPALVSRAGAEAARRATIASAWRCGRCTPISAIISRRSTRCRRCRDEPLFTDRALSGGAVADRSEALRRGVRVAQGAGERSPSAEVLNAIGVVQLRRGSTAQTGKPRTTSARRRRPTPPIPTTSSILATPIGSIGIRRRRSIGCARRCAGIPTDGDAHYVLGAALQQTGAAAEAARERELAQRLSSSYADWDKRAAGGGEPVPRGLERLKDRIARPGVRVESIITSSGQRDQAELATFHLDAGPPRLRARSRSRGGAGAAPRAVPVAVSGRGASAARADPPSRRAHVGGHPGVQDRALERGDRAGHLALAEALSPAAGHRRGARGGRSRAGARPDSAEAKALAPKSQSSAFRRSDQVRSSCVLKCDTLRGLPGFRMATTTSDDGFHEIQLNGKQLVFLFMAVAVVSVVIFLCGVLVGRGVRGERGGVLEAMTTPAARRARFPRRPAPAAPPSGTPATANEDLSYPNRLARSEPAAGAAEAGRPPALPPRRPRRRRRRPPLRRRRRLARPRRLRRRPSPRGPASPSRWRRCVSATRRTAWRAVSPTKGYPAYVMSPDAGAPAVFRVRVGKFKERREAESVAARLAKRRAVQALDRSLALLSGALLALSFPTLRPPRGRVHRADAALSWRCRAGHRHRAGGRLLAASRRGAASSSAC